MEIIRTEKNTNIVQTGPENNYKLVALPVGENDISVGVEIGMPWEEVCENKALPGKLRQYGIYDLNDLINKREQAIAAIQAAYAQDYIAILKKSKFYYDGGN